MKKNHEPLSLSSVLRHLSSALGFLPVLVPLEGLALNDCGGQARTPYESLYCEIKARGEGQGLPSLDDFRRNDARIQALLLQRPARHLGLPLPQIEPAKTSTPPPHVKKNRTPAVQPPSVQTIVTRTAPEPEASAVSKAQSSPCRLLGERIRCGENVYQLALNQNNEMLSPEALSADNKLELIPYRGDPGDSQALKIHLSNNYRRYIEKMLAIGLGSATMSFSKFYYTYQEIVGKGENFEQRFETMYSYLKKDKADMAVKARYSQALPGSIGQCGELADRLFVCDDAGTNWVYVKKEQ